MESIDRHQSEILQNQKLLKDKPILGRIYHDFHLKISKHLPDNVQGLIVELGSGAADITEVIPHCLRTDLFPNSWIDQVENAYALSFSDQSVAGIILFDVFHHLRYPGTALEDFYRVLKPGGRLIIFDPGISLLGRVVFGLLHPEPLGINEPITWFAPEEWKPEMIDYYAAQANADRIFLKGEVNITDYHWRLEKMEQIAAVSYIASGGYSKPQLFPDFLYPIMCRVDNFCSLFPRLFTTRILVVLEKPNK